MVESHWTLAALSEEHDDDESELQRLGFLLGLQAAVLGLKYRRETLENDKKLSSGFHVINSWRTHGLLIAFGLDR